MPDLTITFTVAQANRVAAAVGNRYLNLGRDATLAEVKTWLIDFIRAGVINHEQAVQAATIVIPPLTPT